MLDTIVLTLRPDHFYITDHARFSPSTAGLFQPPYYTFGRGGFAKCVQNPTQEELKAGRYKPRLTVTKRVGTKAFATTLRIEFSVPKLLFGNNFDEVTEHDFNAVADRLRQRLDEMGVTVFRSVLEEASVSAIHYSKNIVLTDYSTPYAILSELAKIDHNQRLDLNQTDFRNGGHALKLHANTYEIVLYDKLKDLRQAKTSEKRAIEQDYAVQLDLFEQVQPRKPFEVLRLEIRIGNRAKLKHVLHKLKLPVVTTFKALFHERIARAVLQTYFDSMTSGYALLPPKPPSWGDFIVGFRSQHPKQKVRKMLQIAGMIAMCSELGVRTFREAIHPYGTHHWPRLKQDLEACGQPSAPPPTVRIIQDALQELKPLKLAEFSTR